ncbi:uncharacterized protein LOC126776188 [Nymphalis io]|uniref:uncharacterized protein LOC126776188 n=1 Tax=Inachis io TaxID=171585 RepID=UPI0021689525|nr:uncharacterized protein LOC126776188 [Nymphalis io]
METYRGLPLIATWSESEDCRWTLPINSPEIAGKLEEKQLDWRRKPQTARLSKADALTSLSKVLDHTAGPVDMRKHDLAKKDASDRTKWRHKVQNRHCGHPTCKCCNQEKVSLRHLAANARTEPDIQHGEYGASHSDQPSDSKADVVARIRNRVESVDPNKARELGGVFLFNIIKGTSVYSWTLDLNKVTVYEGEPDEDPDTTFTLNEHYFKQLVFGKEDPRVIMQAGRCSVTGDIMRAMKLEPYIKLE